MQEADADANFGENQNTLWYTQDYASVSTSVIVVSLEFVFCLVIADIYRKEQIPTFMLDKS